jgi:phospholipase C
VSRALPYAFEVTDAIVAGGDALALTITNAGTQGAPFNLLDVANLATVNPRRYGVEAGKSLTDATLPVGPASSDDVAAGATTITAPGQYFYALHGPNGFVRTFLGDTAALGGLGRYLTAALTYAPAVGRVVVTVTNSAGGGSSDPPPVVVTIVDNAYGQGGPWVFPLAGGQPGVATPVDVTGSGAWYDLTVTAAVPGAGAAPLFTRRFMGRMETGADSVSDPAMAAGVPGYVPVPHAHTSEAAWHAAMDAAFPVGTTGARATRAALAWNDAGVVHPDTPAALRLVPRAGAEGDHKDARWRWDPASEHSEL